MDKRIELKELKSSRACGCCDIVNYKNEYGAPIAVVYEISFTRSDAKGTSGTTVPLCVNCLDELRCVLQEAKISDLAGLNRT